MAIRIDFGGSVRTLLSSDHIPAITCPITNTGDVHSCTFRLYSTHQKQESTSDSSPWFKNGSVSAFAHCKHMVFTQKENQHEKSDCIRVRVIGRCRGKPRVDLSIRERRTGEV